MKTERAQGPTFVTNPIVALIVDAASGPAALRYVRNLPVGSHLNLCCSNGALRRKLSGACLRRHMSASAFPDPCDSIRMANLVLVFGRSPFNAEDIRVLAMQGLPVEVHDASRR